MIRSLTASSLLLVCASMVRAEAAPRPMVVVRAAPQVASAADGSGSRDHALGAIVQVARVAGNVAYLVDGAPIDVERLAPPDRAMELFSAHLKRHPQDVPTLAARGNLRVSLEQVAASLADFNRLIALRPESYRALNQRGFALSRLGKYDAALADFTQAIRLAPRYGIAYYNRGYVRHQQRDFDGAIADFDRALAILRDDVASLNNRGLSWYAKGDADKALQDFDRAIELAPNEALIYNNRGWAWQRKGNARQAAADFRVANQLLAQAAPSANRAAEMPRPAVAPPVPNKTATSRPAESAAAREQFKRIWRDIAVNRPLPERTTTDGPGARPGASPSEGMANVADVLQRGAGLKQDPDLLAAVGVFAPEELRRLEAEEAARRAATERGNVAVTPRSRLGFGPINADTLEVIQTTAIHGIYTFEGSRLIIRGSSAGNEEFANFLGDVPQRGVQLTLVREGVSVADLAGLSDRDRMQGIWRIETAFAGKQQEEAVEHLRFVFRNDRLDVQGKDNALCQFQYVLNPQDSPKTFRLTYKYFRGPVGERRRQIRGADALDATYSSGSDASELVATIEQPASKRSPVKTLLIVGGVLIVVLLIVRFGSRYVAHSGQGTYIAPSARAAPPPRRLHLVIGAAAMSALAGCELIAHFEWQPLPLVEAVRQFAQVSFFSTTLSHFSSWVRDLAFAIVVSFFWMGALAIDVRSWKSKAGRLTLLLAVGLIVRVSVEFLDSWLNANSALFVDLGPEAA
ncbi:MAG: tetratricopeptide repeat protein, partial [Planctomycetales bacterium]|nr:tetratricopeptide repeat protein [Planctomycetales bacterium]